ncbi:cbb3-type cytochrome c oxidase N-terminal domain-containing protein [Desulfurivibrio dismutans]|uniref:cbb3-type cytochrome c oxidase N-terminal domain-containing protein n=1 Tax=Desulfurivibrio dismutans TaxID=1398908 RepID=UPI0023DC5AA2|nr:cbb3-type cytochrome c oxidase N-terminal domain-containing protein [Desulfurivibrio alkaliphilus]MDF1614400.1 cbb3-type cytochrome c oxidase N-terminal domain-containing protein [Desulfurivibrio alkaliphilus]
MMSKQNSASQAGSHSDGIKEGHAPLPGYFKLLFGGLVVWAVLFMGYFLFSGWSSAEYFDRKMTEHQEAIR